MVGNEDHLNKFKRVAMGQATFPNHNAIKLKAAVYNNNNKPQPLGTSLKNLLVTTGPKTRSIIQ